MGSHNAVQAILDPKLKGKKNVHLNICFYDFSNGYCFFLEGQKERSGRGLASPM